MRPLLAARLAPLLLLFAAAITPRAYAAADWVYFRSGPVEVWTNGDGDPARRVLTHFDQARWLLARILGKTELTPLWPVRIVVLKPEKKTVHRTPTAFRLSRESYAAALSAKDEIPAAWTEAFLRALIDEDVKPMPAPFEKGLVAALSTMRAEASSITAGAPPPVSGRNRDWARMHLLAINPEYAGRVRVFFSVLQQGAPLDSAARNAFDKSEPEFNKLIDDYFAAGVFAPQQISGKPLNPQRDYRSYPGHPARAELLIADALEGEPAQAAYRALLNSRPTSEAFEGAGLFAESIAKDSESARAWYHYALAEKDLEKSRAALRKAMDLNPRWAAPHARWAAGESDPVRRAIVLKKAGELDPRATATWIALAEAQQQVKDFNAANQSWRLAERSVSDPAARSAIEKRRLEYEQQRLDLEAAERRRKEEEKRRELEDLKQKALADIRAAEKRANAGDASADPNRKVVEWWDGPAGDTAEGKLERVGCATSTKAPTLLVIRNAKGGGLLQLRIIDAGKIGISGGSSGLAALACGPQRPPRAVKVQYEPKPDPRLSTAGNVQSIEFQ